MRRPKREGPREEAFEEAAAKYRKAIAAADRLRTQQIVGRYRGAPESTLPTEDELNEAEANISRAFGHVSRLL